MNKLIKVSIYFMLFALLIQLFPQYSAAENNESPILEAPKEVVLFAAQPDGVIDVFGDETAKQVIGSIPDGTSVELIEAQEDFAFINYTSPSDDNDSTNTESIWTGYVPSIHIINKSDVDEFLEKRQIEGFNLEDYHNGTLLDNERLISSDTDDESKKRTEKEEIIDSKQESDVEEKAEPTVPEEDETTALEEEQLITDNDANQTDDRSEKEVPKPLIQKIEQPEIDARDVEIKIQPNLRVVSAKVVAPIQGLALKGSTKVYSQTSQNSKVLKTYKQGHILLFRPHNKDWYSAKVYLNGKAQTGFIYTKDVDLIKDQRRLTGFAIKQSVQIYSTPTRNSGILKSYKRGHSLIFRSFTSQWHKATVYVNGKAHTGYIHASDVGDRVPEVQKMNVEPLLKGVAIVNSASVYSSTARTSKKLKTYKKGHILQYRQYNSQWYGATVYVGGKAQTGYIHINDVETVDQSQSVLKGIGVKNPTRVFASALSGAKVLKSYNQGSVLQYRKFTSNLYVATVYVNGKASSGYIHASDLEGVATKQTTIKGFAAKNSTKIYASASTNSKVIKSYKFTHKLTYRTFTDNWYQATVYVKGKAQTGYIHKNDVSITFPAKVVMLDPGHGGTDPGARGIDILEKELNLDIALRAKKQLENAGYIVMMTRTTDVFISLQDRASMANNSNADIFISIHANSFNSIAKGIETFWYGKYERANSIRLANILQKNVVASMKGSHRRVAEGNFHVIRETKLPSALLEVGFIDHPVEAAKLRQSGYRQRAAEGIRFAVQEYFQ